MTRSHVSTRPLTRATLVLLALMCGISIGSAYYAQPLLPAIGRALHVSDAAMGLVPMLTQIGIGAGVLIFMPLGDIVDNRKLILLLVSAHVVTLALVASSSTAGMLYWSSALMGLTTVAPYLLPPFAAKLSPPESRGHVTGFLARGFFAGILLARTVSGYVGYYLAWHAVYWIALASMLVIAALFARHAPTSKPTLRLGYGQLLRSLATVFLQEPQLRLAALTQGLLFGAFNAFWTSLAFYLETPQFHLPSYVAGLFGVIGLAGALGAPLFGKLADRRGPEFAVKLGTSIALLSWVVFMFPGGRLAGLMVGVLLLDLGITASHISNQAIIYRLAPEIRSRVTTLYILGLFTGGASLSRLATLAWSAYGWYGVCTLGFVATAIAAVVNFVPGKRRVTDVVGKHFLAE
ncbi:MFS transporter [Paraburkholderia nemoris]|uniref:MFS transporter n=1 Tax=Paraburkholderia nemoris TaxID=2793076 RepID=UPI0038BD39B0